MPGSPQKAVITRSTAELESSDSDQEVEGLLEMDYEGTTQLESMLLNELFEHFVGLGGLLQAVEEEGGQALAASLARNEKLMLKIGKFSDRRENQDDSAGAVAYG